MVDFAQFSEKHPPPAVRNDWEDSDDLLPADCKAERVSTTTVFLSPSDEYTDDEVEHQSAEAKARPRLSRENDEILAIYLTRDIYFEVVEYEDDVDEGAASCAASPSPELALAAIRLSSSSSSSSSSFSSSDEAVVDEYALWPKLVCTPGSVSVRSPTLAPHACKDLLSIMPPAPLGTEVSRQPSRPSPTFRSRGAWGLYLLDEAIERRYTAALVLTGGLGRSGLPVLPVAVARFILDECLCLAPWLAHFAVRARVDVMSCLHARKIDVSCVNLQSDAADMIGWLMRHSSALQSLDVSHNPLGARGAAAIGRALPRAKGLRTLRLNEINACSAGGTDPYGLIELSAGVQAHQALTKLGLRSNMISASSAHAALKALIVAIGDVRTGVRSLDLSGNPLGHEGASMLAQIVAAQPSLTRLDAASCQLLGRWGKVRDGVRALAAALASSTTLESLDLTDNALGRSSEAMDQWHLDERNVSACPVLFLVQAVRQNASLRLLQLRANHIVGDQEDKLREAWLSRGAPAAGLVL